jgi:hypothetical protein
MKDSGKREKSKIKIRIYLNGKDYMNLQGEEIDVPDEALKSEKKYAKFRQEQIDKFTSKQNIDKMFEKKYKHDIDDFGKGVYRNNEKNRRLGRVGKSYDKGKGLREVIRDAAKKQDVRIDGEGFIMRSGGGDVIKRRWKPEEDKKLFEWKSDYTYQEIGERLLRSRESVRKRWYRIRGRIDAKGTGSF